MKAFTCRKCGRDANTCNGWLHRVSPVGEDNPKWECRPDCETVLTSEQTVIAAIEGYTEVVEGNE